MNRERPMVRDEWGRAMNPARRAKNALRRELGLSSRQWVKLRKATRRERNQPHAVEPKPMTP